MAKTDQEEPVGFDFDSLTPDEMDQVAESIGITLAPAEPAPEDEATEPAAEAATEDEAAEEEASDSEATEDPDALDSSEPGGGQFDPKTMAAAAASCVTEAQSYVDALTELAAQVGQSDKKAAKKITDLGKKAAGLVKDITKAADKAKKAADKDKFGEAADLAKEAADTCAEARSLVEEAKALLDSADLPEDEDKAPPAERAPTRSAVVDWAESIL